MEGNVEMIINRYYKSGYWDNADRLTILVTKFDWKLYKKITLRKST
jgi:TRAP-type mannitol/chloroaromatic compound transport system substrate-binding protein